MKEGLRKEAVKMVTPKGLKEARQKLGLNMTEMAGTLRTPYRTYQDWERGERRIPGICEAVVALLLKCDRENKKK